MNNFDLTKYENLALLGNEEAIFNLACHYQNSGDYKKAFSYLSRIINTNNPTYLRKIGYFFEKGLGVDASKETAFKYYLKSADLGDSISQYNVAICFYNGIGVTKNDRFAFNYALESAKQKYEKALILSANFLKNEVGCKKDLDLAISLLNKCSSDNGDAIYLKSLIYLDYSFSQRDISIAKQLLERGALLNNVKCLLLLAEYYLKGTLEFKDESKGLSLLLKAAKLGSHEAMSKLAGCYKEGIGTSKNLDIAEFWENESNKRK